MKSQLNLLKPVFFNTLIMFLFLTGISPNKIQAADDNIFGTIEPPPGVDKYQARVGADNIGLVLFLSNMIRLITVAAGIWVLFNFISAGWMYILSPGDASTAEKVSQKITSSVIGLVVVALSYSIAGLIGYLVFGDAGYILNPSLFTIT